MKKYEIKQERQENGMWGMPLNCYSIDSFILLDDRKHLLFSATISLINQIWNCPFEIICSTTEGFNININTTKRNKLFGIRYDKYEIIDNVLYEFENCQEHSTFLRKQKLEKLNE